MSVQEARGAWRWPLVALLATLAVSVALACNGNGGAERTIVITFPTPTATPIPTPTPTAIPTPSPTPSPTPPPNVCGVNPDPAPASVLQVQEPEAGERIRNPFHVRGWGSEIGFQDSGVAVALVNANGDPIQSKDVLPESRAGRIAPPGLKVTDNTAPFATDMLVEGLGGATPFCIWVFVETTAEGIPKQVVQVPVVVAP